VPRESLSGHLSSLNRAAFASFAIARVIRYLRSQPG
jgi:hypothetical protein